MEQYAANNGVFGSDDRMLGRKSAGELIVSAKEQLIPLPHSGTGPRDVSVPQAITFAGFCFFIMLNVMKIKSASQGSSVCA